jgi:hypothetical protein
MARRRPPNLGLTITVAHPESETERPPRKADELAAFMDHDGHVMEFAVGQYRGEDLAEVTLRRGMAPSAAAALLRKVADRIEKNEWLMQARQGASGEFNPEGEAKKDVLSLDDNYDDFGNLTTPEFE